MKLEVDSVSIRRGVATVVRDVSFELSGDAQVLGLLGKNGAGKTSLLEGILGFAEVSSGEIRLDGVNLVGKSPHAIARLGIGYAPTRREVFGNMTVRENLALGTCRESWRWRGPGDSVIEERALEVFPQLRSMLERKAGVLSGGEQQMVSVGRMLMALPKVMILDEPTFGLSPGVARAVGETLKSVARTVKGANVIVAEQDVDAAVGMADRIIVLESGEMAADTPAEELAKDKDAVHALF